MKHVCTILFKKLQDKSNEAQTTRSSISFYFFICKLLSFASVFSDASKHSKITLLLRILSYRLDRLKIENILWKIEKCRWELDRASTALAERGSLNFWRKSCDQTLWCVWSIFIRHPIIQTHTPYKIQVLLDEFRRYEDRSLLGARLIKMIYILQKAVVAE